LTTKWLITRMSANVLFHKSFTVKVYVAVRAYEASFVFEPSECSFSLRAMLLMSSTLFKSFIWSPTIITQDLLPCMHFPCVVVETAFVFIAFIATRLITALEKIL